MSTRLQAEMERMLNDHERLSALADAAEALLAHPETKAALETLVQEAKDDAFALRASLRKAVRAARSE